MQRYQLPGYNMQLVGELQRQQTDALFCDTLLQCDGISVPTHSCVLAALSPYLSGKLSTSPSPASGQKRQLQLQTVKAKTLLKLVGLLYSGVLEVKGSVEQNDVLAAVRQFGITDLVKGHPDAVMTEGECEDKQQSFSCSDDGALVEEGIECGKSSKRDAQVQTGTVGSTEVEALSKKSSGAANGTQSWIEAMDRSVFCFPSLETAPSVCQSLDISMSFQPRNITTVGHLSSTTSPPIPRIPEAPSDVHSESSKESSETNPTSTVDLSNKASSYPFSPHKESSSRGSKQPSATGNDTQVLAGWRRVEKGTADGTKTVNGDKAEQQTQTSTDDMQGGERGRSDTKSNTSDKLGAKNLALMKEMMETTQISVKVKLRRTPKGKVWEVVRIQDADESLSAFPSLNQDAFKIKMSQDGASESCLGLVTECEAGQGQTHDTASAEGLVCCLDESTGSRHTSAVSCLPVLHSLSTSDLVTPASTTTTVVNESDSDVGAQSKSSQCCTSSSHTSSIQNFTNPNNLSFRNSIWIDPCPPTDYAGMSDSVRAQNQPSYSTTPALQPYTVPLSKPQSCLHPKAPTTRPDAPIASYPSGKPLHYPASQLASSTREEQGILEVRQSQGNEAPTLFFMDDLCLPTYLSPLAADTSLQGNQPVVNNSPIHKATTHQSSRAVLHPPLQKLPWLVEHPVSQQVPLSNTTLGQNPDCESSLQYKNFCCQVKKSQEHLEVDPKTGCPGNWVQTQGINSLSTEARRKSKQVNAMSNGVKPKRMKRKCSDLRVATNSLLAYKDLKVSDARRSTVSLSACSVSLVSNNVLAKEREMAIRSGNEATECAGNPNSLSAVTESWRENARGRRKLASAEQVLIRTRGFLKKQETPSDTSSCIPLVTIPSSSRARMRGRPQKIKLEEIVPAEEAPPIIESYIKQQILSESHENKEKPKTVCRKRMRNLIKNEGEDVPRKRVSSTESTDKANAKGHDMTLTAKPKAVQMVTLKEFQSLIQQKHLKIREFQEKQAQKSLIESVRNVQDEGKTCDATDSIHKEVKDKTRLVDITHTRDRDGIQATGSTCGASVGNNLNRILYGPTNRRLQKEEQHSGKKTGLSDETYRASGCVGLEEHFELEGGPEEEDQLKTCDAGLLCQMLPLEVRNMSESPGCDQEDEEEVDILTYSPFKRIQIRESEEATNSMESSPDEEEEDVNVTDD